MRPSFERWRAVLAERPELLAATTEVTPRREPVAVKPVPLDAGTLARLEICRGCDRYEPVCPKGGRHGRCAEIEGCSTVFILRVKAGRCPLGRLGLEAGRGAREGGSTSDRAAAS